MEQQHPLNDLMSTAMEKIRTMVDANTIIGTPIQTGDVPLLPVAPGPISTVDRIVDAVPEVVDKVTEFIEKQQEKKAQEDELG